MRRGHTRLALPALVLLLSVACTSNDRTASPATTDQPAEQTAPAAGTEATLTPETPATEAPQQAAPSDRATQQAPPPAPQAPRAPRAPAAAQRENPQRAAADASTTAREAGREAAVAGREAAPAVSPEAARPDIAKRAAPARLISIPAATRLPLILQTDVASDTSNVEDRVSARVASDVVVDDEVVIPEGSHVAGRVTYAQPSGKVKGRAGLTVRFYSLTIGSRTYDIAAEPVRREARGTKSRDVRDIGIGAGAGAVIGGIIGGRKGAGIGAAVGGAGGAGKVLATAGEEVRLPAGTSITTSLAEPLVVDAVRTGTLR